MWRSERGARRTGAPHLGAPGEEAAAAPSPKEMTPRLALDITNYTCLTLACVLHIIVGTLLLVTGLKGHGADPLGLYASAMRYSAPPGGPDHFSMINMTLGCLNLVGGGLYVARLGTWSLRRSLNRPAAVGGATVTDEIMGGLTALASYTVAGVVAAALPSAILLALLLLAAAAAVARACAADSLQARIWVGAGLADARQYDNYPDTYMAAFVSWAMLSLGTAVVLGLGAVRAASFWPAGMAAVLAVMTAVSLMALTGTYLSLAYSPTALQKPASHAAHALAVALTSALAQLTGGVALGALAYHPNALDIVVGMAGALLIVASATLAAMERVVMVSAFGELKNQP